MNALQNSKFFKGLLETRSYYITFKVEIEPTSHEKWGYYVALSEESFDLKFIPSFFEVTKETFVKCYDECFYYISNYVRISRINQCFVNDKEGFVPVGDDVFLIGKIEKKNKYC